MGTVVELRRVRLADGFGEGGLVSRNRLGTPVCRSPLHSWNQVPFVEGLESPPLPMLSTGKRTTDFTCNV